MLYEKNPKWVCIFQINLNCFADVFFKLRTNNFFFWRVQRTKQNCLVLPCCPPDSIMLLAYSFGRRLQIPQPFLIMFNVLLLSTEEGDNTRILKWWSNLVMMFSDRFGYLGFFSFSSQLFCKVSPNSTEIEKKLAINPFFHNNFNNRIPNSCSISDDVHSSKAVYKVHKTT